MPVAALFGHPPLRGLRSAPLYVAQGRRWCDHVSPGGAGTTSRTTILQLLQVLGSSASLIGSELPWHSGSGPSLCPAPMLQGCLMYTRATSLPICT